MASYGHTVPAAAHRQAAYGAPVPLSAPTIPAGTFSPGTKIDVGGHRVVIQKYLSEGGFAHVYLVKLPKPINGTEQAVLKRVAVPDKESLRGMRIEVETMKRLKGHKAIVTYIDSHASELRGGGYEVFLLMEYCNGGGLIDFMNTRLQHRLTEPEILNIFSDVAEGVACMHYLRPPLLHRDLKVENVLITVTGSRRKFKLCDFGSAASPKPAPTTVAECRLMDEDVQKHTTMQYRSPEMIDVYRKQPIDEKSDIWALGVLLYKLCYYTTPFEEQGQLAILNATYRFPSYPSFSDRLKKLIASMLKENPQARPNIYQVLQEACSMQSKDVPVKNIYNEDSHLDSRGKDLPAVPDATVTPVVGAVFSPSSTKQQQAMPEIERMRRGRPPAASQTPNPPTTTTRTQPSPSPSRVMGGDPFAALDNKLAVKAGDELSSRFPTLTEFSLLHQQGSKFDFDTTSTLETHSSKELAQRVAEKLADEAFQVKPSLAPANSLTPMSVPLSESAGPSAAASQRQSGVAEPPVPSVPSSQRQSIDLGRSNPYTPPPLPGLVASPPLRPASAAAKPTERSRASAIISSSPALQAISSQVTQSVYEPAPIRPAMVSTGTMTSTPPPERLLHAQYPNISTGTMTSTPPPDRGSSSPYPIHRFPPADQSRVSSVPRQPELVPRSITPRTISRPDSSGTARAMSQQGQVSSTVRHAASSRPSLESGRPDLDGLESLTRSISQGPTPQPRTEGTYPDADVDHAREWASAPRLAIPQNQAPPRHGDKETTLPPAPDESRNISSNVEFLRTMEDSDSKKKEKGKEKGSKHGKRASLSSLGVASLGSLGAGTKSILAGRFGDAFKRFEGNSSTPAVPRILSPLEDLDRRDLTPITGSEATDGRSDDGHLGEDAQMDTPEMRRDREQRMLADEEARVAAAQAEYRQRLAQRDQGQMAAPLPKSIGGVSRAVSIQNKVQSLLEETSRSSSPVARTAEGYGHFTDPSQTGGRMPGLDGRPVIKRKPTGGSPSTLPASLAKDSGLRRASSVASRPVETLAARTTPTGGPRPVAPQKPAFLNTMGPRHGSPPKSAMLAPSGGFTMPKLRGNAAPGEFAGQPEPAMTQAEKEDYLRNFRNRFPSLTSIEMVERDLSVEPGVGR